MSKLGDFDAAAQESEWKANRLLFQWLSDDGTRAELYRELLDAKRALTFQSRADIKKRSTDDTDSEFHQEVTLLATREHVIEALKNDALFSNSPYGVLGSGTFMLGLDRADKVVPGHDAQRAFAAACLGLNSAMVDALASAAFLAAAVLPLKQRTFDLADLAEQAAARFAGFLFGYEQADHALIERAMRAAYRGLNYQIVGRHFASEPGTIQEANAAMGALLKRTAELIDLYGGAADREQRETFGRLELELKELRKFEEKNGTGPLTNFTPLLRRMGMGEQPVRGFSGNELAVITVGLIAGTIGNIQASVSIAINEFFRSADLFERAHRAAFAARQGEPGAEEKLRNLIWEALRLNPPAAFLPRRALAEVPLSNMPRKIPKDSVVILAMGAAMRDLDVTKDYPDDFREDLRPALDPLIFGGPENDAGYIHQCVGQRVVMPVISRITRGVVLLPGLARSLDAETGLLRPLEKRWGIICEKYPLEFNRQEVLRQSPLIVIMKVRTPVAEHAEKLKLVIKYGAPRIEKKLQDSLHVHFASFLFIENDTKLALFTWYDRDFDSYIEHFAREIGPLFDRIFEHIQDPPPLPVNKFQKEFVDTIRRYNARPAADYFFSAYPAVEAWKIVQHFPRG